MNRFLPIQLRFNTYGVPRLSLLMLTLSLSLGVHAQANAQPYSEIEVLSVPAQEAFFVEEQTEVTPSSHNSDSQDKNTSGDSGTQTYESNSLKHKQNQLANTTHSASNLFKKNLQYSSVSN